MRGGESCELVIRVVPRLHADQHSERRIFDVRFAGDRLEPTRRQKRLCVVGVILED